MGYSLKTFVSVLMTPELERIVKVVDTMLHGYGLHAVITSGNDGKHMPQSLHYNNLALDFRISDWPDVPEMARQIQLILGQQFDVVVEHTHIHVEFDEKRG